MARHLLALALGSALACGGGPPDVRTLARGLESSDAATRKHAAESMGELGTRALPAIGLLHRAVLDPDPEVRVAVVNTLAILGAPGRKGLAVALNDEAIDVRRAAARGLLLLGPAAAESTPSLIAVLDDPAPEVAQAARSALVAIGPDAITALLRELVVGNETTREHCAVALVALGEPALEGLVAALDATAPEARKAALSAIASITAESGHAPATLGPALDKLATDKDPAIVEAASRLRARTGA